MEAVNSIPPFRQAVNLGADLEEYFDEFDKLLFTFESDDDSPSWVQVMRFYYNQCFGRFETLQKFLCDQKANEGSRGQNA